MSAETKTNGFNRTYEDLQSDASRIFAARTFVSLMSAETPHSPQESELADIVNCFGKVDIQQLTSLFGEDRAEEMLPIIYDVLGPLAPSQEISTESGPVQNDSYYRRSIVQESRSPFTRQVKAYIKRTQARGIEVTEHEAIREVLKLYKIAPTVRTIKVGPGKHSKR